MSQESSPQPTNLPTLLTVPELASVLRLTDKAIYRRAQRGEIPGVVRLGGRTLRFRREEILRWIDEGSAPQAAEESAS